MSQPGQPTERDRQSQREHYRQLQCDTERMYTLLIAYRLSLTSINYYVIEGQFPLGTRI